MPNHKTRIKLYRITWKVNIWPVYVILEKKKNHEIIPQQLKPEN